MEHLIKDTKKRTAQRKEDDKMHPMSQLAIFAGLVILVTSVWWVGVVVDAITGLITLN